MEPIDELLAQLKAEYEEPAQASSRSQRSPQTPPHKDASVDNILQELQQEYQEQNQLQQQQRQQELVAARQREEEKRQRRRQALTGQAQEWLTRLDPHSDEGLWFEEFSYSYQSKLEAAVDYLEALRETRFGH